VLYYCLFLYYVLVCFHFLLLPSFNTSIFCMNIFLLSSHFFYLVCSYYIFLFIKFLISFISLIFKNFYFISFLYLHLLTILCLICFYFFHLYLSSIFLSVLLLSLTDFLIFKRTPLWRVINSVVIFLCCARARCINKQSAAVVFF
jgi:hypothetical protein